MFNLCDPLNFCYSHHKLGEYQTIFKLFTIEFQIYVKNTKVPKLNKVKLIFLDNNAFTKFLHQPFYITGDQINYS